MDELVGELALAKLQIEDPIAAEGACAARRQEQSHAEKKI